MDFVADLHGIFCADLARRGYDVSKLTGFETAALSFFNVERRTVRPKPRRVQKSQIFSCPPSVQPGLALLEEKILRGDDINAHQSRSLQKTTYEDGLFNDWGIHHFHLGTTTDASGFVARTGPILFARVEEDVVNMIDVRMHGAGHKPWFEQELVRIIHRNWPKTIARFRPRGVLGVRPVPTDEDIEKLRRAGACVSLQMPDGTVYMPPGLGQSTAKTSIDSRRRADATMHLARDCEEWFRENSEQIEKAAANAGTPLGNPPDFRLKGIRGSTCIVKELKSGFICSVPSHPR